MEPTIAYLNLRRVDFLILAGDQHSGDADQLELVPRHVLNLELQEPVQDGHGGVQRLLEAKISKLQSFIIRFYEFFAS